LGSAPRIEYNRVDPVPGLIGPVLVLAATSERH
jgi:hypothetical protein